MVDVTSSMPTVPNVSFSSVTIEQTTANTYEYNIEFSYTKGSATYDIEFKIIHKSNSDGTTYKGLMSYQIEDTQNGGNCGSGANDITRKGSLVYQKDSADSYKVDAREAEFCTHSMSGGFGSDGQLDPSDKYNSMTNPDGWGNNFSSFVANYKISNRSGQYLYAWQAGYFDNNSRVLEIDLNDHTPVDGESYFGFGDDIASSSSFGEILGMICNWAGPGNSHTPQSYVQRQFLTYNSTTKLFETTVAGSDITYAPTNSCMYDGSGTFEYDRDLDGNLTSSDIAVVKTGASSGELEFDLFTDSSYTKVADMITARGSHLPTAPIWP